MGYSPIIGRFLQRDPIGYLDMPNLYELEDANPVNALDPIGLAPTTQPSPWPPMTVTPVTLGNNKGFRDNYVTRGNWGSTEPNGHITLSPLQLPSPLPDCLKSKERELQKAIDTMNFTAYEHELEAQDWFAAHPGATQRDRNAKFQDSAWEHEAMFDMYSQLRDLLKDCECDKSIGSLKADVQKKLRNYYNLVVKDGVSVFVDPDVRSKD